jgi:hypothetical protein
MMTPAHEPPVVLPTRFGSVVWYSSPERGLT